MSAEDGKGRGRPRVDEIPCPFMAAAYNSGDLVVDEAGTTTEDALADVLEKVGLDPSLVDDLSHGTVKKVGSVESGTFNVFELKDSAASHTGCTGIRDPHVDPQKFEEFVSFGEGGRMYRKHLASAANHYRAVEPGLAGTATETIELSALIEVFGREDEDGHPYLTFEDLYALWVEARYPDGWKPRAPGSIKKSDLFGTAAKIGALRIGIRGKQEVQQAMQTFVQTIKDLTD